jgi:hypothetical protein
MNVDWVVCLSGVRMSRFASPLRPDWIARRAQEPHMQYSRQQLAFYRLGNYATYGAYASRYFRARRRCAHTQRCDFMTTR